MFIPPTKQEECMLPNGEIRSYRDKWRLSSITTHYFSLFLVRKEKRKMTEEAETDNGQL